MAYIGETNSITKGKPNHSQLGPKAQVNMFVGHKCIADSSFRCCPSINFTYQNRDWWLDSGAMIVVFSKPIKTQAEEV